MVSSYAQIIHFHVKNSKERLFISLKGKIIVTVTDNIKRKYFVNYKERELYA